MKTNRPTHRNSKSTQSRKHASNFGSEATRRKSARLQSSNDKDRTNRREGMVDNSMDNSPAGLSVVGSEPDASNDFISQLVRNMNCVQQEPMTSRPCRWMNYDTRNILWKLHGLSEGVKSSTGVRSFESTMMNLDKTFHVTRTLSVFDRRCTVLEWHPRHHSRLAVGSKSGDVYLWDIDGKKKDLLIQGRGPGGYVAAVKFHPHHIEKMYTAALDGKVALQDLSGIPADIFLDTMTWEYWYTSLDVNHSGKIMVAGDSRGYLNLLTTEGERQWEKRLHKNKITHAEFSPREPWLLCTASVDHFCKFWDIRMLKDKKSALCELPHEKGINSAYFSLTDGCRLLTTDQYCELRVYRAPFWQLEKTIIQPHRFFQHLTPIKAMWHPLQDVIVVGRYPDNKLVDYDGPKTERGIDLISAESGKNIGHLQDASAQQIVSLNKFNHRGDALASTMGWHVLIWKSPQPAVMKHASAADQQDATTDTDIYSSCAPQRQSESSRRSSNRSKAAKLCEQKKLKKR